MTVGGRIPIKTDVRIIAATNKSLETQIALGLFREDLFYRLNVVPLRLPPLRERREDIPDLVRHFMFQAEKAGLPRKTLTQEAFDTLKRYNWPGNVRELENLVRRLSALYSQEIIGAESIENEFASGPMTSSFESQSAGKAKLDEWMEAYLSDYFSSFGEELPPPGLYGRIIHDVETPLINAALAATRGNQIKAAELLGLNRNTLRKKVREQKIKVVRTPSA
jgi:two-component system nitrogen regulation response regulator GlnG